MVWLGCKFLQTVSMGPKTKNYTHLNIRNLLRIGQNWGYPDFLTTFMYDQKIWDTLWIFWSFPHQHCIASHLVLLEEMLRMLRAILPSWISTQEIFKTNSVESSKNPSPSPSCFKKCQPQAFPIKSNTTSTGFLSQHPKTLFWSTSSKSLPSPNGNLESIEPSKLQR